MKKNKIWLFSILFFVFIFSFGAVIGGRSLDKLFRITGNNLHLRSPAQNLVVDGTLSVGGDEQVSFDTDGDGDTDLRFVDTVPSTATDTCTTGDFICYGDYCYWCKSTDVWVRSTMATW